MREPIFWAVCERVEREKINKSKLLSSIYGVLSIGVRRAKNESSFTRRGLLLGTENTIFSEDSNKEFRKSKVLGLGSVHGTS